MRMRKQVPPELRSSGMYIMFKPELKNHVLIRRSDLHVFCKGPADFDCGHSDASALRGLLKKPKTNR